jgi:RNA polymerase sigma factor (sigma-70 family)
MLDENGPEAPADLSGLYPVLAKRLELLVRRDVQAPEIVVEEACQFAWACLVHHRRRVRTDAVLSWLTTTAVHEALKLVERSTRDASLDAILEQGGDFATGGSGRSVEAVVEARDRLRGVGRLGRRQQRVVWLRALGLSHEEIARHDNCSPRSVERQLKRARARLRSWERAPDAAPVDAGR